MPDAVFVVVKDDGVISDGQLSENSIFQQHFDVASHRSVADFGLNEKAVAVFPQLQRSANGEPAVVVQGEYLHPLPAFGDCLREGTRLNYVPAAVDVAIDRSVATKDAALFVVLFGTERQRFVLRLGAFHFHPFTERSLPRFQAPPGGIVKRRDPQMCRCELRRHNRVIVGNIRVRACGAVLKLRIHPGCQGFQVEPLFLQVDTRRSGGLLSLHLGKFHQASSLFVECQETVTVHDLSGVRTIRVTGPH